MFNFESTPCLAVSVKKPAEAGLVSVYGSYARRVLPNSPRVDPQQVQVPCDALFCAIRNHAISQNPAVSTLRIRCKTCDVDGCRCTVFFLQTLQYFIN